MTLLRKNISNRKSLNTIHEIIEHKDHSTQWSKEGLRCVYKILHSNFFVNLHDNIYGTSLDQLQIRFFILIYGNLERKCIKHTVHISLRLCPTLLKEKSEYKQLNCLRFKKSLLLRQELMAQNPFHQTQVS